MQYHSIPFRRVAVAVLLLLLLLLVVQAAVVSAYLVTTPRVIGGPRCNSVRPQKVVPHQNRQFHPSKSALCAQKKKPSPQPDNNNNNNKSGVFIKSALSKEIYFDQASGRFFETTNTPDTPDDKDDTAQPGGGFSLPQNPFQKPEGTFFQELFNKDKDNDQQQSSSVASTPTKKAFELPSFAWPNPFENKQQDTVQAKDTAPESTAFELPSFSLPNPFGNKQQPQAQDTAPTGSTTSTTLAQQQQQPFSPPSMPSFLSNLFKTDEDQDADAMAPAYERVVIAPDFRVAAVFLTAGLVLDQLPVLQFTLGPLVTLLGLLFLVQTFRIRFVFTETNDLALETVANFWTGETVSSGDNIVVGGANVWACDRIVNYDFFPGIDDSSSSSPVGPILVYFKETQTDPSTWNEGPGRVANDPSKIAAGQAVAGQVHFFPAVCNVEQIRDEFVKRNCRKL